MAKRKAADADYTDPVDGFTYKAGSYTPSFRDHLRATETQRRADNERQAAGMAALRRQGRSSPTDHTKAAKEQQDDEKKVNGKRPYKYFERVECQAFRPLSDDDGKHIEASYEKRAKEKVTEPVIKEAWGAAIDVNDPKEFGIFGVMHLCNDEGPHDADGFPLTTMRLVNGFLGRLDFMADDCVAILSKIGADKWPYDLPYDATELQKDAHLFLRGMVALCKRFEEGDLFRVMSGSFSLGVIYQRINVRWAEKHADAGRRRLLDAAKGRDTIKRRKEKRYREINRTVARCLKQTNGDMRSARSMARKELGLAKTNVCEFKRAAEWAKSQRR
jgi:hypothetical protein